MNEPLVKTRLAFVFVNGRPLNVLPKALMRDFVKTDYLLLVYLLAGPRLAEALDFSTVAPHTGSDRSAPKPLPISKLPHPQHPSDHMEEESAQKQQSIEISQLVDKQTKEITIKKAEVMKDQERVEPAVIDTQNAVKSIKKQHRVEVRSMANPPPLSRWPWRVSVSCGVKARPSTGRASGPSP